MLRLLENGNTLLYCLFGFGSNHGVIVVGNRVCNYRKGKAGHAGDFRHGPGGRNKSVGNNGRGSNAGLFRRDGVVQTARRATPSIANRRNHRSALPHLGNDLGRRRTAGIGFAQTQDIGHAVA